MTSAKNLYAILGVNESAGPDELRRAYLALAVKYHPDRNPGDPQAEERFKDISQAYAVLSDPAARAKYDRTRPRPAHSSTESGAKPEAGGPEGKAAEAEPREKPAASGGPPPREPDIEEILAGFFKSDKGREILNDLAAEFKKAGLSNFRMDDLARWLKNKKPPGNQAPEGPGGPAFLAKARDFFLGRPDDPYDLVYQLSLNGREAGQTIDIRLKRQGPPLKVKLPNQIKDGASLRLPNLGLPRPDGTKGSLIITIKKQ